MYELKVEKMSCGHCAVRITQAVKSVDPAAGIEIDLPSKRVRIACACELQALTAALAEAGYPAEPLSSIQ